MTAAAVLGGGAWGATLAWLLARSDQAVVLWTRDARKAAALQKSRKPKSTDGVALQPNITVTASLADALGAGLLVVAVPPAHVRALLRSMSPHLLPSHRIVHVIKGFEVTGALVSKVIEEETCVLQIGALAGPVVPSELWKGQDTAAVVGSRFGAVVDEVTGLLASPQVRVYGSADLVGVEIGGALRTAVALAGGMLQGLGLGRAVTAVLLTRAVAEGGRLAEALGGDTRTLAGLSGIGDWMLTVTDPTDPVLEAGKRLAKGEKLEHDEAAARVATLQKLAAEHGVEMPIVEAVASILAGTPVQKALHALMTRAQRPEFD